MISDLALAIAGTVASDGSAAVNLPSVVASQWAISTVTAQHLNGSPPAAIGNPNWVLSIAGQARGIASGPQVEIGPRSIGPGQPLLLQLTGGIPGSQVVGTVHGARGDSLQEILASGYAPMPNLLTMSSLITRQKLYPNGTPTNQQGPAFPSFSCAINTPNTQTFTLPSNATNVRIIIVTNPPGSAFQTRMQVVGHQNQLPFSPSVVVNAGAPITAINGFRPVDIRVDPSLESQVDITVNGDANNALSVFVSAMFGAETTVLAGITSGNGIPVTFNVTGVTPAPWQAANQIPVRIDLTLGPGVENDTVAGVAGVTLYVINFWLTTDTASPYVQFLDTGDNVRGTAKLGAGGGILFDVLGGFPIGAAGTGFRVRNAGAGNVDLTGTLIYSTL